MLVADADVPGPVINALKTLQYPISTYEDIGAPIRPDTALMEYMLRYSPSRVLVTMDTGIPSQAYTVQYLKEGLTVVLLRWKTSTFKDFQEMASMILRYGEKWEQIASGTPSIISVTRNRYRTRAWRDVPGSISLK